MKIIRQIEFTGKNLNDIFNLPCVKCVLKVGRKPVLVIWGDMMNDPSQRTNACCHIGQTLIEYDNCKWAIIRP